MGKQVTKSNAEETAVIQNIAALVQQLQSMEAAEIGNEGGEGEEMNQTKLPGANIAMKGEESGRTEAPQNVMNPDAKPKEQGIAPWDGDDEVKKAMKMIAKAMQASDTDGSTANDSGEERAEELPEVDEENVKEVAKMLAKMMGKKTVAKSRSSASPEMAQMFQVMKSLADRVEQQGAVIGELLEGLGVAKSVVADPATQVQKSQGNRPYGALDGGSLEAVVMAVAKGMAAAQAPAQSSGIPMAAGFGGTVQKDMSEFVQAFGQDAGWIRKVGE